MSLFPDEPPPAAPPSLEERWHAFHTEHPHVYALFERFVLEAVSKGRPRIGARMVWERMRWYCTVESSDRPYRLNDHHPPYYAREFLRRHPWHAGLFQLRRVQGEDHET